MTRTAIGNALGLWKKDWTRLLDETRADGTSFLLTDDDLPGDVLLLVVDPAPEHVTATSGGVDAPVGAWAHGIEAARLRGARAGALSTPVLNLVGDAGAVAEWRTAPVVEALLGYVVDELDGPPTAADGRRLLRDLTNPDVTFLEHVLRWFPPAGDDGRVVVLGTETLLDDLVMLHVPPRPHDDRREFLMVRRHRDAIAQLAAEAWVAKQAGSPIPPEDLWGMTCRALGLPDHPPEDGGEG